MSAGDAAVEHGDHAVGAGGEVFVVGDDDDRGAVGDEAGEQVEHDRARLLVEAARRFVGDDELGAGDECSGHGDPLLFTTTELRRQALRLGVEADGAQRGAAAIPAAAP